MNINSEQDFSKPFSVISALSEFAASKVRPSLLSIMHSSLEGVIIVDATHRIVLVNHKAECIFGYSAAELLEQPLEALLPSRLDSQQRRHMDRLATAGKGSRRARLILKGTHANGTPLSLCASVSRVVVHGDLYLALIIHDGDRRQAREEEPRRMARPAELRRWAVSSQHANEVEKRRFSKKLYDDIGQRLSVLKLDLDWLENSLPDTKEGFPARVAQMQGLLDNVITMTKSMASALRPPLLDDFGLLAAVEWMAENFQKKTGILCTVEHRGQAIKLEEPAESAIFRVIQEGMANIERHAHARCAKISFVQSQSQLDVMIRDDGIGLGNGDAGKPGCYGLLAMQERVFILGGTIRIENAQPAGVAIHASIPLETVSCLESNNFPMTRL